MAAAVMSFAAMAQHTNVPQVQKMSMGANMMPAAQTMAVPSIMKTNQVSYLTKDCLFDAQDGEANAYSFMLFDYRLKTPSVVYFTTDNPREYKMMVDYGQVPGKSVGVMSSTFIGDKILAYCYLDYGGGLHLPHSWCIIDPKTGMYETKCKLPDGQYVMLNDMTYDPETKLIYALEEVFEDQKLAGSNIYTIDPEDSQLKLNKVAYIPGKMLFTLAADRGNLYSVVPVFKLDNITSNGSQLIKMPISSIKDGSIDVQNVGDKGLGLAINWSQSMEFDKVNHKLWWIAQTNSESYFCEIDPETGKLISKDKYDYTAQAVGLSIPSQDVNPTAPSYVRNLKAAPAEGGVTTVSFSWTNPDKDFYLGELKSLKSIKIIRDGEVVNTINATGIGQAQTYDDTNVPSGVHFYKIQTVNENGDGAYKELKAFVGHDLPGAVSNIKVVTDGCKATISWDAPVQGVNNGWIDQASLKYDVVRFPDNVKIASDVTECQVNDEVTKSEGYYYEITAKNNDGEGATAKSEVVPFGPDQEIPFFTTLATENEFNRWTAIDNNGDYSTWKFDNTFNVTCYERAEGPADDYLVSPVIRFEEGKKYQIRFKYWTINWVEPTDGSPIYDKMDVYYAQEPTAEAFQKEGNILDLGKFHTASETYLYAKQVFTAQPGEGYLAFHAYSDANRSIIYIQDVCVREYSATDLSITDFKGSISAVQGTNSAYGVEVMNEGSAMVKNYKVELINKATGEVLATEDGVAIDPEQKKIITVNWTPSVEGEIELTARVNLEGDTYVDDNTWKDAIEVSVEPSGSANWLSLNEDDAYYAENGDMMNLGYAIPFNCGMAYSMVQCIYLDKEITKRRTSLSQVFSSSSTVEQKAASKSPSRFLQWHLTRTSSAGTRKK